MTTTTIRLDSYKITKILRDLTEREIPFAIAKGLTITATGAKDLMKRDIPEIFDHTNPFTRNAVSIKKATKHNQTAEVFIKDQQAKYLSFEEYGGTRTPQDSITNPNAKAIVLGTKNAKKTASGNLAKNYVKNLAAQAITDKNRPKGTKGKMLNTSIVKLSGHGPNGVGPGGFFKRNRKYNRIFRLISFEDQTSYKEKFGFLNKVEANVQDKAFVNIDKAMNDAMQQLKAKS